MLLQRPLLRLLARLDDGESFTAMALLIVLGAAWAVDLASLPMAVGAFVAGVLLAECEYRNEIHARVAPFKGVLLGLFFIAVGMTADISLILDRPIAVIGLVTALLTLIKVPPLWAAALAAGLNLGGVVPPPPLADLLADIGDSVPALMLLALGMGLTWGDWRWSLVPAAGLVVVLQLAVQPALVAAVGGWAGLTGEPWQAVALEAAMPTMILGVVLCDRYGLDTGLYAKAVTLTTAASLVVTPLWYGAGA